MTPSSRCSSLSKRHGLLRHAAANARPQTLLGHYVYAATEQFPHVHQKPTQIREAASGCQINQENNITCFVRLPSCDRAKDTDVSRAMGGGELQDFVTIAGEKVLHRTLLGSPEAAVPFRPYC